MHNDAQQCNGPVQTGPFHGCYMPVNGLLRAVLACKFKISKIQKLVENKVLISTFRIKMFQVASTAN